MRDVREQSKEEIQMTDHHIALTVIGTEEELTVESRTSPVNALQDQRDDMGPNIDGESVCCSACTGFQFVHNDPAEKMNRVGAPAGSD